MPILAYQVYKFYIIPNVTASGLSAFVGLRTKFLSEQNSKEQNTTTYVHFWTLTDRRNLFRYAGRPCCWKITLITKNTSIRFVNVVRLFMELHTSNPDLKLCNLYIMFVLIMFLIKDVETGMHLPVKFFTVNFLTIQPSNQ